MAIAFDNASGQNMATGSSFTFSHTCTGSNLILFVSSFVGSGSTISSVTYNGDAMTIVESRVTVSSLGHYLFRLFSPATGANNVVITPASSVLTGGVAASYTGVDSSGIDASSTNSNSSTPITGTVTTVADNCWVVMGATVGGDSGTAGTGTTVRVNQEGYLSLSDNNGPKTPAGSVSLSINCAAGVNGCVIASIKPSGASPAVAEEAPIPIMIFS